MIKKIATVLLAVVMMFTLLTACGKKQAQLKASITMPELAEKIKSEVEFAMMMETTGEDGLSYAFSDTGLTTDMFTDYSVNVNMIVSADTLIIVEAKDSTKMDEIKDGLEAIKNRVHSSFEFYLPEPFEKAGEGKIASKGNYAMLVISADNDKAIKIFEDSIK